MVIHMYVDYTFYNTFNIKEEILKTMRSVLCIVYDTSYTELKYCMLCILLRICRVQCACTYIYMCMIVY